MIFYSDNDKKRREIIEKGNLESEEYRTDFRRDYARLIHSPSFRRLQGKTQLYPGIESDFFRNRLTHSLEVAQIAKSIAIRINNRYTDADGKKITIDYDLVEFAGLAHDLGHPPFGHQGEEALDLCMMNDGGFEGNAQTLRIISKLEKRDLADKNNADDKKVGLNLTYRSLASILKYDEVIPVTKEEREKYVSQIGEKEIKPVKGYYECEKGLVGDIKKNILGGKRTTGKFKTVECKIMDIADDIAYSTYDLEDAFKAGFTSPLDILFADENILENVRVKVSKAFEGKRQEITMEHIKNALYTIFKQIFKVSPESTLDFANFFKNVGAAMGTSKLLSSDGYNRTILTSNLVGTFIRGVEFEPNYDIPALSNVYLNDDIKLKVEVLKTITYELQIRSPRLKIVARRGMQIVSEIFRALTEDGGHELLPDDYRHCYEKNGSNKKRVVCDFVSGMTDKYAIEFYGRLTSENPETIFKPFW